MKTSLKSDAILTIIDGGEMSPAGRKILAAWLRRQAKFLLKHGHEFAPRFRASYVHEEGQ
jgi:hypothetical protein